jgi:hypothetical protein
VVGAFFLYSRSKRNRVNDPASGGIATGGAHQDMSNVQPPAPEGGDAGYGAGGYGGAHSGYGAAAAGAGLGAAAGAGAGAAASAPSHDYKYGGPANHPPANYPPTTYPTSTAGYYANTGAPTVSSEAQSDLSPPGSVAPGYYQQPTAASELQGSTHYASTGHESAPHELGSNEIRHSGAPHELPTS